MDDMKNVCKCAGCGKDLKMEGMKCPGCQGDLSMEGDHAKCEGCGEMKCKDCGGMCEVK